ncbi:FAD binding domain-containing protein [Amycolatopsis sp. NPDC051903]|uniref:FAD binding domain-containing protein n=1 Tax=Amycolatopsis sp. NPDC051903 TaxID=3363936 RepID=UPI0037A7E670
MKPVDFTLHRPETVAEAVELLAANADEAKVLAGGQSLVPLLNFRLARPEHVIDLGRLASLTEIRRTPGELVVGAMVRQAQAEHSAAVAAHTPLLAAALPAIAHPPIRNRGTVGGSLAHADAAAELPSVALALDATLVAHGPSGIREIAAADFFRTHLTTALAADELLTGIRFPSAAPGTGAALLEIGRRRGDFALVGVAVQVRLAEGRIADARVCFSGVDEIPHRCRAAEAELNGAASTAAVADRAADAARDDVRPSGDLHATAAYRRDVAGTLLARAVAEAVRRAEGDTDAARIA